MVKNHLKRIAAPKHWTIGRKTNTFVTRPKPGRSFELAMPLSHVLKELLKKGQTTKEVRFILQSTEVLVNGRRVHDHRRPIGFMDVISFPSINEHYRMTLSNNGKLVLATINDAAKRVVKISGKTRVTKGTQINCLDGTNLLVEKDVYKPGDSVLLVDGNVNKHLPLKEGASIMLTGGRHLAVTGTVKALEGGIIRFSTEDGELTTALRHAYVIGIAQPEVSVR